MHNVTVRSQMYYISGMGKTRDDQGNDDKIDERTCTGAESFVTG
jgi:hypothetical protein